MIDWEKSRQVQDTLLLYLILCSVDISLEYFILKKVSEAEVSQRHSHTVEGETEVKSLNKLPPRSSAEPCFLSFQAELIHLEDQLCSLPLCAFVELNVGSGIDLAAKISYNQLLFSKCESPLLGYERNSFGG